MRRLPDWLPHDQINLGLDLQGGSHLLLEVDIRAVVEERLETLVDDIRSILRRIGYRGLGVRGDAATLILTDPASAGEAVALLDDLNPNPLAREIEVVEGEAGRIEAQLTESAVRELGIRRSGSRSRSCAGGSTRSARASPRSSARGRTASSSRCRARRTRRASNACSARPPSSPSTWSTSIRPCSRPWPATCRPARCSALDRGGQGQIVVRKRVEVSGESLVDAQPSFQQNEPVVSFRFDRRRAQVRQRHP